MRNAKCGIRNGRKVKVEAESKLSCYQHSLITNYELKDNF